MSAPATINRRAAVRRAWKHARSALRRALRDTPKLTLSQWAAAYRVISPPAAEAGPWRNDRLPYLTEIMDTISGSEYQDITVVKSAQSGGTEGCINNAIGYYIDQEPSAILVIQPNVRPMAEGWSKERLAPMLRDTPRLQGKVRDARSRDSGNTVLQKSFPGGFLVVVGANSPAGLASWAIRILLCDELDRWPASAGTEGDPLALAEARQITYRHRRKCVKISTPGNDGESRIQKEWLASDQRHFEVPCPHCGEYQPLEWRDSGGKPDIRVGRGPFRLVWEKSGEGETVTHKPETTAYVCRECGALIDESAKPAMLAAGKWVKHNPESKRAGFHISGLLQPWVRWRDTAARWLRVHDDPEQRKTFVNTVLGLTYEVEGEQPDPASLAARRETYAAEVPAAVGALTMAIDVQGDRLECEVRGWADREESYVIRLERILGDPEQADVWQQAERLRVREWKHESGASMRIRATMVDSGYLTDTVYRYVRPRFGVYAYKGADNAREPVQRALRPNKDGIRLVVCNPVKLKDVLFARLRRRTPGPGYLHIGTQEQTGADDLYLHQYGAEKKVVPYVKNVPVPGYIRLASRRNEAIDLYVMNLAAIRNLGRHFSERLGEMASALKAPDPDAVKPADEEERPQANRRPWGEGSVRVNPLTGKPISGWTKR